MTDDILRLLREPELARRIGEAARSVSRESYCIQCVIEQYLTIYRGLLGTQAAGEG